MKSPFRKFLSWLGLFGVDAKHFRITVQNWPTFRRDLQEFERQKAASSVKFAEGRLYPILTNKDQEGGSVKGDYFHQDLLVAQKIYRNKPDRHIDIGSRVDGFVAHVAVFREIEIMDIRPMESKVPNIKFQIGDLMSPLPPELIECCDSLSCLHALEHFGLGRYGDPINYEGYLDGLRNMNQILKPGGKFYFSVPIGPQRVEFNAHRVFSPRYLWELLEHSYRIETFSYVDDGGDLHKDIDLKAPDLQKRLERDLDCTYGCGIFELIKR